MVKRRKEVMMRKTQDNLFQMMMMLILIQVVQEVNMTLTSYHYLNSQGNQQPKRWKKRRQDVLRGSLFMLEWLKTLKRISMSLESNACCICRRK